VRLERLASLAQRYYRDFTYELERYRRGEGSRYAVERLAQLLAQVVIDYAAVMAASRGGGKPGTYRELVDMDMLSKELGESLEEEAFREIERMMPAVIEALKAHARGDPCIGEVAEKLRRAAEKLGVKCLFIFGSLARKGCGRDVDAAVLLGRRPRSALEIGRIQAELEHAAGAPLDLVVLDLDVPVELLETIVGEAILVYGGEECVEERARLYLKYLDFKEWLSRVKG